MERAGTLTRTKDLEKRPQSTQPEEPLLAAILAAALVEYRRRLAKADVITEPGCSDAHWQTMARWQQLAPTTQHQFQRQR
ncbi:MAG: hypothetical protein M8467_06565 [Anaerolineae bacterium]|nr:hypothetical protein [Anaerolineae bacterium]